MLFASRGFEKSWQLGCPFGQFSVNPLRDVSSNGEFCVLVTPADCGHDVVWPACTQFPAGELDAGVPMLCVSTPEDASASLLAMVLLTICTFNESCNEMPAPSQPATLFTIMLLVIETLFQRCGWRGKVETSVPLTCCRRMPPPLPLSALLPWIKLPLIVSPRPVPSLSPGGQSASI